MPRRRQLPAGPTGRIYSAAKQKALTADLSAIQGMQQERAMVAAGARVNRENSQQLRRLIRPWQQQALMYYDTVGECWYAAQFYARALSKIRLYAAKADEQGEIREIEDMKDPGVTAWDLVQDPGGGRSQLQAGYGRLLFLLGEAYCCVTPDENVPTGERWEMLSSDELRIMPGGGYSRYQAPSFAPTQLAMVPDDQFEPLPGEAVVYRFWKRHPRYSQWSDAPMNAVLGLFEELQLLQLAVRARAKSRLSGSGILYVPSELTFGTPDGQNDEASERDVFMEMLQESMLAGISEPGAASAVVPIVVRGPAEHAEGLKLVQIHDPMQTYPEEGLRAECIKRIATGLDLPPELLLGMADANHWTAWQIDDATWTAHLQPVAEMLCQDFATTYLRPYLREQGVADWDKYTIGYDAADVVNHPDRVGDAKDLNERGALSGAKLREVAGFTDDDAMSEEEHAEWLAIKLRDRSFIQEEGGVPEEEQAASQETVVHAPPDEQLQNEDSQESIGASAAPDTRIVAISAAAGMAVKRARELAGARLRTKSKGCPSCVEAIDGVPNGLVASVLGVSQAKEYERDPMALIAGGMDLLDETLHEWGLDEPARKAICRSAEIHAARTLYHENPDSLPLGFAEYVARVL